MPPSASCSKVGGIGARRLAVSGLSVNGLAQAGNPAEQAPDQDPGISRRNRRTPVTELRDKLAKGPAGGPAAPSPQGRRRPGRHRQCCWRWATTRRLWARSRAAGASASPTASARPSGACQGPERREDEPETLKQGFMRNVKLGAGPLRLLMSNLWPPSSAPASMWSRISPDTWSPRYACAWACSTGTGHHFGGSCSP